MLVFISLSLSLFLGHLHVLCPGPRLWWLLCPLPGEAVWGMNVGYYRSWIVKKKKIQIFKKLLLSFRYYSNPQKLPHETTIQTAYQTWKIQHPLVRHVQIQKTYIDYYIAFTYFHVVCVYVHFKYIFKGIAEERMKPLLLKAKFLSLSSAFFLVSQDFFK